MSDNYQTFAFDSIDEKDAHAVADHAIRWLVSRGYIADALSECSYGSDGLGHKPCPNWREIIDEVELQRLWNVWSARTGKPSPSAHEDIERFLALQINGVEASRRRSVHTSGQNCGPGLEGTCPGCKAKFEPDFDLAELAGRWWEREAVALACPSCLVESRLEDWDWQPDWAFAEAAVTFWNWPPICAEAISDLSTALGSVRIRRIDGRL